MKNPYDEKTQNVEYNIFEDVTSIINMWMVEKCAGLSKQINNEIKPLILIQNQIKQSFDSLDSHLEKIKEKHANYIIGKIENFLSETYPDISNILAKSIIDIGKTIEKYEKNQEKLQEKLQSMVKSETLFEDVYKLRDEFKEIKKFYEGFSKKIKKAFDV